LVWTIRWELRLSAGLPHYMPDAAQMPFRDLMLSVLMHAPLMSMSIASVGNQANCMLSTMCVDTQSFVVAGGFRGFKMVPPGPHFLSYNAASRSGDFAPTIAQLLQLAGRQVVVRRWSPQQEMLLPLSDEDEVGGTVHSNRPLIGQVMAGVRCDGLRNEHQEQRLFIGMQQQFCLDAMLHRQSGIQRAYGASISTAVWCHTSSTRTTSGSS
jgi:AAR2 protein